MDLHIDRGNVCGVDHFGGAVVARGIDDTKEIKCISILRVELYGLRVARSIIHFDARVHRTSIG